MITRRPLSESFKLDLLSRFMIGRSLSGPASGDRVAMDKIIERYKGFVRLKANSYFLAGGEIEDLIQEGLIGLFKAVRDYRVEREASFRSFAELCVTRQIITAIKTAARNKHSPLNTYISFSHSRAGSGEQEATLAEVLAGDPVSDPMTQAISTEELRSLLDCLGTVLSDLEHRVLGMYLEGRSYEEIADIQGCTPKTVDNALNGSSGRSRCTSRAARSSTCAWRPNGQTLPCPNCAYTWSG